MPLLSKLFHNYFPVSYLFFDLFNKAAKNLVAMAGLLSEAVNLPDINKREVLFNQISKLKITGDDITHKIYLCLDKVFFTPLNRNDIHALASAIENMAHTIHEAGNRMYLYNIEEFVPAIKELTYIILQASIDIEKALSLLRSSKNTGQVSELCRQIKTFEQQSDQVYYHALANLFLNDKDPIHLIKYREILFSLETTINKCKSIADVLEISMINR